MDQSYMKEKPLLPLVLKMSLPMVASMLIGALYNIVDSFFVAQVSEDAMTAVSLVFPLQNLANAAGIGFGVGINAAVSYFLGAGRQRSADRAAGLGTLLSLVHGLILIAVCLAASGPFVRAFTQNPATVDYALEYLRTVILFTPAFTLGLAFEKILQAVGKMKTTMFCMAAGAVANIILDPLFIMGWGFIPAMGVFGAALATGLGQVLSLICYLAVFFRAGIPVRLRLKKSPEADGGLVRRLYFVGVPATLNLALPSFMITALNAILAAFSETYVLILGVYYKLQTFIYFTVSGVVQGIRPLVGYNLGAGRPDRVRGIFRITLIFSAGVMAVGTLLCLIIPEPLMGLFAETPETVSQGAEALRIISAGFVVSALSVVVSGVFEGLGRGMPSLVISLLRYVAIIPIAWGMSALFGAVGVWHSFWITELIAALAAGLLFAAFFRRHLRGTALPPEERSDQKA